LRQSKGGTVHLGGRERCPEVVPFWEKLWEGGGEAKG